MVLMTLLPGVGGVRGSRVRFHRAQPQAAAGRGEQRVVVRVRHPVVRGGVLLTAAGREVVLDAYERRMLQMTRGALPDFAGTLRRHLYRQAQVLAAWVEGVGPGFVGLSWR